MGPQKPCPPEWQRKEPLAKCMVPARCKHMKGLASQIGISSLHRMGNCGKAGCRGMAPLWAVGLGQLPPNALYQRPPWFLDKARQITHSQRELLGWCKHVHRPIPTEVIPRYVGPGSVQPHHCHTFKCAFVYRKIPDRVPINSLFILKSKWNYERGGETSFPICSP